MSYLSPEEESFFRSYISQYAPKEEASSSMASTDRLLRFWREAKEEYLLKTFGGNLILEKEISYEACEEELLDIYYKNYSNTFFDQLKPLLAEEVYHYLAKPSVLLNNKWELPSTVEFPLPNNKSFKTAPNMKITRILGKLASAWNIPGWKNILRAQSLALTAKHATGTLCLSIHPLDYITMSDNEEDWESCMSWREGGCYRAGTIEMMNSPYVVIGYLKHPTHKLNGFWNSKLWRELFIVHKDVITNIKPYPYTNVGLTKLCLEWLAETVNMKGNLYRYSANKKDDDPIFAEKDLSIHFRTNTMYNDCGRVDQYMYLRQDMPNHYSININYSGERECIYCGNTTADFEDESCLLCFNCEEYDSYYCDHCGKRLHPDDVNFIGETCLCRDCYLDLAVVPYDRDEAYYYEDTTEVYLRFPDGEYWDSSNGIFFSNFCQVSHYAKIDKWHYDGLFFVYYNEVLDKNLLYEFGLTKRLINQYDEELKR